MDGAEQNVGTLVEDELRSVAVMHVDIDDGDFAEGFRKTVGGDRRIVQEARAAHQVRIGMMARGRQSA